MPRHQPRFRFRLIQRSRSLIDEHGDEPRHSTTQPNYAEAVGKAERIVV